MPMSLPSSITIPDVPSQWGGGVTVTTSQGSHHFYIALNTATTPNAPGVVMETIYERKFVDALAFNNPKCWSDPEPVVTPRLAKSSKSQVATINAPLGLFAIGSGSDGVLLVWTDSSGDVWGANSTEPGKWGPRFQFEGVSVAIPSSSTRSYGISAYWYRDALVLVWWTGNGLMAAAFPLANLKPSSTNVSGLAWSSSASASISRIASLSPANACVSAVTMGMPCKESGGANVATDSAANTTSFQPVAFISVSDTTSTAGVPCSLYRLFIDTTSGVPTTSPYQNSTMISNTILGTLSIDPSSVLYLYWQEPGASNPTATSLTDQASGMALSTPQNTVLASPPAAAPPSIAYMVGAPSNGTIGVPPASSSSTPTPTTIPSIDAQVYRTVFYLGGAAGAGPGTGTMYVDHYSTLYQVTTTIELTYVGPSPTQPALPAIVAKGIIDGPVPIPQQNLVLSESGGTIETWDYYKPIAKIVYGENSAEDVTHRVAVTGEVVKSGELQILAGFKDELSLSVELAKVIGLETVVYGYERLAGERSEWSTSKEREQSLKYGIETVKEANVIGLTTRVLPPSPKTDPGTGDNNPQALLNTQGFVFGSTLAIAPIAIFSLPPGVTVLSGRPSTVTFLPRSVMHVGSNYTANYAFTPGDLNSYSIDNINTNMAKAYSDWKAGPASAPEDPFGSAYSSNYFKNVVEKYALRIGRGGKNYLEFSVGNDGMSETRFDLSQERFREWAVTVSNKTYTASVMQDEENFLGVLLSFDYTKGKEISFSANTTDEIEEHEQWGISVAIDDFPQATMPNQVCGYTFRLYFLPSNNLWVQELLCFSDYNKPTTNPANVKRPIDPASAPWKIMFVVDQSSIVTLPPSTSTGSPTPA